MHVDAVSLPHSRVQEASAAKDRELDDMRQKMQAIVADSTSTSTQLLLQKEQLLGELKGCKSTMALMEEELKGIRDLRDNRCPRKRTECDAIVEDLQRDKEFHEDNLQKLKSTVLSAALHRLHCVGEGGGLTGGIRGPCYGSRLV